MLTGIKLRANPTSNQKLVLSQWMGCARSIWNAKVDEERYYRTFARKYYPIGTYAPLDQKTSQFKSKELSPWLYQCPSQILRNSAVNWYQTYQKFMKGACGRPKRKPKTDKGSIYLTREVFHFDRCEDGNLRLFIGTKTNNIGYLSFKAHRKFEIPNSLYVRKERGQYTVSFCYENGKNEVKLSSNAEHLAFLQGSTKEYLEESVIGVDRGVAIPAHAGSMTFDFCDNQKKKMTKVDRYIKRLQRKLARQTKGSNRRNKTKHRIATHHAKKANIRNDFAHKTSRSLVDSQAKVIVFEALSTSRMTRKPKAKQNEQGRYVSNKAKQKAGLNKSILNVGWHIIETYTKYKAYQAGKAVFKIPAPYTSQECAQCDHTHPDNRKSQELFVCGNCGNTDNADNNASLVIKKRAINLILDTGTVLSDDGVLRTQSDSGRGGNRKTSRAKSSTSGVQRSVKKEKLAA
ncbi:transposase [Edwardsiella tarda]|uniref:RNA-guided endonuclease InsQ/TnpB family protein n=1 Tax=Gammaproteobacteria TaxID=1236 RepID=UPI00155F06F7|nr:MULTISPECIES: RNA-guided endonuclease TnpB family protein [Vibrio]EKO3568803.1 transposase [Vibrio metschnikovii]EKQ5811290.1 transposase [Vibrio metschnikovii]MBY8088927.1 transposase [Vibrio fluvialis]MBY8186206.1 transposase [Vibrio fluvialis]MCE7594757.1 transposase [Vibrio fluvialis]